MQEEASQGLGTDKGSGNASKQGTEGGQDPGPASDKCPRELPVAGLPVPLLDPLVNRKDDWELLGPRLRSFGVFLLHDSNNSLCLQCD
jgi:hypothetical protein